MTAEQRIASNDADVAAAVEAGIWLLCECGAPGCTDSVVVTSDEHRAARAAHARLVSLHHAPGDGGRIIMAFERYTLVVDA
jgi:hypothetical protein